MTSVWGELKRRNVVKVAVAYAIVGWLLIEVTSTVFPLLQLPDWTATFVAMLLILGFPIALLLSWAYELTPEGMKRSREVQATESITHITGRKLDFAIIGALVLVLGFVVYNYVLEDGSEATGVLPNSVAVLLCDNLSPDPDDAYFAEGIHEEILNQLVKIRALNVIARTSVLQYADAPPPIPQIAKELNVGAVMECSVRHAGDSIMVTAQLIDPETNSHLWSDAYPGDLSDLSTVFAMQADIAMNIANALQAEFSLAEQESIEKIPTSSPAAYSLYLRALSTRAFVATSPSELRSAVNDLDRATVLDPQFALVYGYKALLLANRGRGRPDVAADWEAIAEEAARRALALDSDLAWAHAAMGGLHHANWRQAEAQRSFELAYRLKPNDTDVLAAYAFFKWDTGQYEDALPLGLRIVELDPNGTAYGHHLVGLIQFYASNYEAAAISFRKNLELNPGLAITQLQLARSEVARGNNAEGIRGLQAAEQLFAGQNLPTGWVAYMAEAYARAGRPDDATRLIAELETRDQLAPIDNSDWTAAALAMGDYEEARRRLQAAIDARERAGPLTAIKANVYKDPVLEEPQWRELRVQIYALD